jgi:peptidyl-prolyl cis-trans isomerase D
MYLDYYAISKSLGKKLGVMQKQAILISYEGTQVPNKKEKELRKRQK